MLLQLGFDCAKIKVLTKARGFCVYSTQEPASFAQSNILRVMRPLSKPASFGQQQEPLGGRTAFKGWNMANKARKIGLISACTRKRLTKQRGSRCEICEYPGYLEVHHIVPVKFGGRNEDTNYQLLCEKCHADAHGYKKRNWLDPNRKNWGGKA